MQLLPFLQGIYRNGFARTKMIVHKTKLTLKDIRTLLLKHKLEWEEKDCRIVLEMIE